MPIQRGRQGSNAMRVGARVGGEQFVIRWHIDADTLVLERDDALGIAATPWMLNPWTASHDGTTSCAEDGPDGFTGPRH
jgi:hypothetical protein